MGAPGELPEDYIPGGQLQVMFERLEEGMERNHKMIEELRDDMKSRLDEESKQRQEIIQTLHNIEKQGLERDKQVEKNKQRIDIHATVLKLAWGFISAILLALIGYVIRGIVL